jgi:membrane protein DedA with SNARE-associated domain
MSDWVHTLGLLAGQNRFLAYFIIYLATIFLGNISAFASFWLVFRGVFGPWGVPFLIITIYASEISGDLLWYALGMTLRDTRLGNFVKNHLPGHKKIEEKMHKSRTRLIFFSKFLYASSFPVIFMVGWSRIKFKKFIRTSAFALAIWVPILTGMAFGLFSGLLPLRAIAIFKQFEIAFFIGLALFVVADYFVAKLMRVIFGRWWKEENGEAIEVNG